MGDGPGRLAALACAVAILVAAAGCTQAPKGADRPSAAEQLAPSQVRDYQGKKLDSITDFRENSIKGPQYLDPKTYRLTVDGLVAKPASYTYGQVLGDFKHFTKVVQLDCVEGWSVKILWEGVNVRDVLASAGVEPAARTVILHAHDGYTTSFPVEYLTGNDRLLAYKMNGVTMPPERGFPFQLVAEDKWGYKWIKWIERIELSPRTDYRGYWESRGYSNDGSRKGSFLGN
jgi:DMSO/TMAO reductase YedYZ molybdopterin-dependent catalytic subunit